MTKLTTRPDLTAFVQREGRLPRLGDTPPPWHYRGWLLPYVFQLHGLVPAVADRWDYHLRTLEAGKLLDEPIPQIAFGPPDDKVFSLLHDWSRLIGWDCGGWSDFRTLLDWLCWGLSLSKEMPRLADGVNEKLYRQVNLGPLLERPHDYLGEYVAVGKSRGWNPTGFYPTPHSVVELMVRMTMHDTSKEGRDPRTAKVCDSCVGSGRMLLHASNFSLCLFGQDIDPLAVAMCKINGALYAPWLSFPLPASILSSAVPPPPAPLPVPNPPPAELRVFRADDRGQGLLFPM
jgi:N-6 DNA Methylase